MPTDIAKIKIIASFQKRVLAIVLPAPVGPGSYNFSIITFSAFCANSRLTAFAAWRPSKYAVEKTPTAISIIQIIKTKAIRFSSGKCSLPLNFEAPTRT